MTQLVQHRKRGWKLGASGLILGLLFGLVFVWLQQFISQTFIQVLRDELRAACSGCELKVAAHSFSLLDLEATALQIELIEEKTGAVSLSVPRIIARVSLRDLWPKKIIYLDEIILEDLFANHVTLESGAYRFIDHLITPSPESLKRTKEENEDRFRIKLLSLTVPTAKIANTLNSWIDLEVSEAEFSLNRDSKSDVLSMQLKLHEAELLSPDGSLNFTAAANIHPTDDFVYVKDITAKIANSSHLQGNVTVELEEEEKIIGAFSGEIDITEALRLYEPPAELSAQGNLNINLELVGTMLEPQFSIELLGDDIELLQSKGKLLRETLSTHILLSGSDSEEFYMTLDKLSLENTGSTLSLSQPWRFMPHLNDGEFNIRTKRLYLDPMQFDAVAGSILATKNEIQYKASATTAYYQDGTNNTSTAISLLNDATINGVINEEFVTGSIRSRNNILNGTFSIPDSIENTSADLSLSNFPLPLENFLGSTISSNLNFNKQLLNGTGRVTKEQKDIIAFDVSGSILAPEINFYNSDKSLTANAYIIKSEESFALSATFNNYNLQALFGEEVCSTISGNIALAVPLSSTKSAHGTAIVEDLLFGCGSLEASLVDAVTISYADRRFSSEPILLTNNNSNLAISSLEISDNGLKGQIEGTLFLQSLLPFVSSFDDLRGIIRPSLSLGGSITEPLVYGTAQLERVGFDIGSAELSGRAIEGTLDFEGSTIELHDIRGELGTGRVIADGRLDPFQIWKSELSITVENFEYKTADDIETVLSGAFTLNSFLRSPRLMGRLNIDSARFEREFDLRTLTSLLLSRIRLITQRTRQGFGGTTSNIPNVELDLQVSLPGDSFILTNFASVELAGDIEVQGSTNKPLLDGTIQALRGWIGFQNRKFDISSGILRFSPDENEPSLSISAESYVPTRFGDNLLVFLNIEGPISQPSIKLSSDSGLPENEVLRLVTTSFGAPTALDSKTDFSEYRLYPMERLISGEIDFFEFLQELTKLDSIFIEPSFNQRRGGVEPSLVVTKQLSDPLSLEGRSYIASTGDESSLLTRYQLSDRLELRGGLESSSTYDTTALASDLAIDILPREKNITIIDVQGLSYLSEKELLFLAGVRRSSMILADGTSALETRLLNRLKREGYFDAKVIITCSESIENRCRKLTIEVNEGPPYKISHVTFSERSPSEYQNLIRVSELIGDEATDAKLQEAETSLVAKLREQGYLSARVNAKYNKSQTSDSQELIIDIFAGQKIRIEFEGTSIFSRNELLDTIDIRNRKQPFGPNTATILERNIGQLYRKEGYLETTINHRKFLSPSKQEEVVVFTIEESPRYSVSLVFLDKIDSELKDQLLRSLRQRLGDEWVRKFLKPNIAFDEEVLRNSLILEQELVTLGYQTPSVDWSIEKDENLTTSVNIKYTFTLGEKNPTRVLRVVNVEGELLTQERMLSDSQLRIYKKLLLRELDDEGYLSANIEESTNEDSTTLTVNQGELATFGTFQFLGLDKVPSDTIIQKLQPLLDEHTFNSSLLGAMRNVLLRLGLFSRVELKLVQTQDHIPVYDILIDVQERNLRTFTIGGGVHSELGVHGFGEALDRSLFLDGKTVGLRFDGYYDPAQNDFSQGVASLRFFEPHLFESQWKWTEEITFQNYELATQEFNLDRVGLNSGLLYADVEDFTFSFGHTLFRERLSSVPADVILSPLDSGTNYLSFLSSNIGLDRRDNPTNPRSGYALGLETRLASELIGSDADYTGVRGVATFLYPLEILGGDFVLASHTKAGRSWSFADTSEIPISQRYYLGGRTSVRGFRENSLGPQGSAGGVIGGDVFFSQNLELQWYVTEFSALSIFFDAGGLFLGVDDIAQSEVRESAGVGLRLLSPIGPVGFDIASPLDERSGEPSVRFHFSIGTIF